MYEKISLSIPLNKNIRSCFYRSKSLALAFNKFGDISTETVRQKRYAHKAEVIKALDDNTRISKIGTLTENTKYNRDELSEIYNWASITTDSFLFSFDQLYMIVVKFLPFWLDIVQNEMAEDQDDHVGDLQKNMWNWITKGEDLYTAGNSLAKLTVTTPSTTSASSSSTTTSAIATAKSKYLTFDGLCVGLSQILKGNTESKFGVCVELVAPQCSELSFDQVVNIVNLVLLIYQRPTALTTKFVKMVWGKEVISGKLSRKKIHEEILQKPTFVEFFDLAEKTTSPW